ncbi:MAG: hypothetical protein ACLRSJ_06700, partial [Agathobaculum sp.]
HPLLTLRVNSPCAPGFYEHGGRHALFQSAPAARKKERRVSERGVGESAEQFVNSYKIDWTFSPKAWYTKDSKIPYRCRSIPVRRQRK